MVAIYDGPCKHRKVKEYGYGTQFCEDCGASKVSKGGRWRVLLDDPGAKRASSTDADKPNT